MTALVKDRGTELAIADLEDAYADEVRAEAAKFMPEAVRTLVELARGVNEEGEAVDTTPAVRRQSANDIIAHGRPGGANSSGPAGMSGFQIVIQNFSGRTSKQIEVHEVVDIISEDGLEGAEE